MTMKHNLSTISALAVLVLGAARLEAQPATASAEQLFRDGKRLMTEGNIAAACEAFDGSYRTEPTISTLLNLADCRERNQQYASAWGHFLAAARLARTDPSLAPMLETAQRRATALERLRRVALASCRSPSRARARSTTSESSTSGSRSRSANSLAPEAARAPGSARHRSSHLATSRSGAERRSSARSNRSLPTADFRPRESRFCRGTATRSTSDTSCAIGCAAHGHRSMLGSPSG